MNREKSSFYKYDDERREIVFNRYDMPSPWMNYLTNGRLFTMISQAGGNLSWYKSPEIWRIGRYNFYNMPVDVSGLFVYIQDEETGKVWNPTGIPCEEKLDFWQSAHGLGYTRFSAKKDGVQADLTLFISDDDILIGKMQIRSEKKKRLQVYVCQEMGLMQYLREVQWQCYCKNNNNILFDKDTDALVYEYFCDGQPRPDETPFVFFAGERKCRSFSGSRQDFIGYYRNLRNPIGIENRCCGNTELRGGEAMFSMQFEVEVSDETEDVNFYLGTLGQTESLADTLKKIRTKDYVENAFTSLKNKWETRLSAFQISVPDKKTERMVNTWNALQVLVNFYVCREISYYATGTVRGIGVRDASQDLLANIMYDLEASKEKIKLIFTQQFKDGSTTHYFYPIEKSPSLLGARSDNHLWLVYAVYQVLVEEGKTDFLFEKVPYYDGGEGTVLEHIRKSIDFTVEHLGVDGLPLMLCSDWNDMLVNVCKKGLGESVFVSQMLCLACRQMIEICKKLNIGYEKYETVLAQQTKVLNEFCWDGKWFIRAVSDEGLKIGAEREACGKIWLNSQSWAVISDTTTEERKQSAMRSVTELLDVGYGLTILYPALQRNYPSKENELTFAQPGIGENAGVFCHANTWAIMAECMLGNHEEAYKIYTELLPESVVEKFGVDHYNAEPYIYTSNIRGPQALLSGQAGVSWLTGTSSWMLKTVSENMFGLQPTFDGLKIVPCLPNAFKNVSAKRVFRGTTYEIDYENPNGNGNKVKAIYVDGEKIDGNVVFSTKEKVHVTVVME